MNKKFFTWFFLALLICQFFVYFTPEALAVNVPPTPAFNKFSTDNATKIRAMNYSSWLHLKGLHGIQVLGDNLTKTIYFNATISNGTTLTAITCIASRYVI